MSMQFGDVVMMRSATVVSTARRRSKDKVSLTLGASDPNGALVFLYIGTTTADTEHLLKQDGTVEAILKDMGFIPDPELKVDGDDDSK